MPDATTKELLAVNQMLLDSIVSGDWQTYQSLCDPSVTCFEAEARGQLVEGLGFHRFYFTLSGGGGKPTATEDRLCEFAGAGWSCPIGYTPTAQP